MNHEMPLVPFIDFLLCLISFLLITAVWSQSSRLAADAAVPGQKGCGDCAELKDKRLHVEVKDQNFVLSWKQGSTVIAATNVARKPIKSKNGTIRYPDLAMRISEEWKSNGVHLNPSDTRRDQAVLHTSNTLEFGEVVAVMDAVTAPDRTLRVGRAEQRVAAFNVTFAAN